METDELLYLSNVHECSKDRCLGNKYKVCKARFPRDLHLETSVDTQTGALILKKGESWINTFSPDLTYLLRCNTDVTSLQSGTAIKSVIAYVTDYITKSPLKTHVIFDAVKTIFTRNMEETVHGEDRLKKGRSVITKIVNALTAKSEIGSPMASMYLLKHGDHYTSHMFQKFYWRPYVNTVKNEWESIDVQAGNNVEHNEEPQTTHDDKVMIAKNQNGIVAISPVLDYVYRPKKYEQVSLYNWISMSYKTKFSKSTSDIKSSGKGKKKEWDVDYIVDHKWQKNRRTNKKSLMFLIQWTAGDTTWETLENSDELTALDNYLSTMGVGHWSELPDKDIEDHNNTNVTYNNEMDDDSASSSEDVNSESEESEDSKDSESGESEDSFDVKKDIIHDGNNNFICEKEEDTQSMPHTNEQAEYYKYDDFLPEHPQYQTYKVHMLPNSKAKVPDFIGGALPRHDRGNREEYCMTMLTFFRPWRSGLDLKSDEISWNDEFEMYNFSERERDIMKYFNLRYECNDARDDYAAQRRMHNLDYSQWPSNLDQQTTEWLDKHDNNDYTEFTNFDPDDPDSYTYSNSALLSLQRMAETEALAEENGLLVDSVNTNPDLINTLPDSVHTNEGVKHWHDTLIKKRDAILQHRYKKSPSNLSENHSDTNEDNDEGIVKVVDESYFTKMFKPKLKEDRDMIENISKSFTLNDEQSRAFKIVANHATLKNPTQLKMYLGGMAGTGKSQVIKALIQFFTDRNEEYRFTCIAPTGAAASLIGGSTYHSFLGMNTFNKEREEKITNLTEVKANLRNIDYIFFDEVSMLDCRSLYNICKKMCRATGNEMSPFGGKNMILAGDFAQLPPAGSGKSLYAAQVHSIIHRTSSYIEQETSIGKALWHQFTTVVILRQNMRQRSQSANDAKFRTVLENLRYKSCTTDDIAFLRKRIAGNTNDKPRWSHNKFRNVSVVCTYNAMRDKLNDLGSIRFVKEVKKDLEYFYSLDKLHTNVKERKQNIRKEMNHIDPLRNNNTLTINDQQYLWNLPPSSTSHHPGKIGICVGMPIMIKKNKATECSVTNGAEGVVVGWKSRALDLNHNTLEMIFVKLTANPTPIKLPGLPENVVPIIAEPINITCKIHDGRTIDITRTQVPVLLNFGMTDFASQGRTRQNNVVDIHNCKNHQSIYTCLSRGSTYEGTLIIRDFSTKYMTGGLDGYLRQEFRELELLDEITRLRYHNKLPTGVKGQTRSHLISSYRQKAGSLYVPPHMPGPLKWSSDEPYMLADPFDEAQWEIIDHKKINKINANINSTEKETKSNVSRSTLPNYISAKGTVTLAQISSTPKQSSNKRKRNDIHIIPNKLTTNRNEIQHRDKPIGFEWDAATYSCAYDSLFAILLDIKTFTSSEWRVIVEGSNKYLKCFDTAFDINNSDLLESKRQAVRRVLWSDYPSQFPLSRDGADIHELCDYMLTPDNVSYNKVLYCKDCKQDVRSNIMNSLRWWCTAENWKRKCIRLGSVNQQSITNWILALSNIKTKTKCPKCASLHTEHHFICNGNLPFLHFVLEEKTMVQFDPIISYNDSNYRMAGIIYFGDVHFTCRIIDQTGQMWYNDGIQTGRECRFEGNIRNMHPELLWNAPGRRKATSVIYSLTTD